jgi:hypothetical protein
VSKRIELLCAAHCRYKSGQDLMSFAQSKDERLLAINVRTQVEMDKESGGLYRFAANGVKQYAEKLRKEIERRRATGSNSPKSILSDSTGCEPLGP